MGVDRVARWRAIQDLAKQIAYKDEAPTEVESALCGAVLQVKAFADALTTQQREISELRRQLAEERASNVDLRLLFDEASERISRLNDALNNRHIELLEQRAERAEQERERCAKIADRHRWGTLIAEAIRAGEE